MDANGQRFWLRADESHWNLAEALAVEFDAGKGRLRLASRAHPFPTPPPPPSAETLARVPQTRDTLGTRAFWDSASHSILCDGARDANGTLLPPERLIPLPPHKTPLDLVLGHDAILYVSLRVASDSGDQHELLLIDRRGRFSPITLATPECTPSRLASDPAGGLWILDRPGRRLAHLQGQPPPRRSATGYQETTFRPVDESPSRPRVLPVSQPALRETEAPIALACSPGGRLALLNWEGTSQAVLRVTDAQHRWLPPRTLARVGLPFDLVWITEDRLAVMTDWLAEAPAFAPDRPGDFLEPLGDYFPLRQHDGGPFAHSLVGPPHFPTTIPPGTRPLHRLSLTERATQGHVDARTLDSRRLGTTWHRVYLEAILPPDTGIILGLGATEDPDAVPVLFDHVFGEVPPEFDPSDTPSQRPARGVWLKDASEIPQHPGLLEGRSALNRAGLFTVLIQRPDRAVRSLQGRYLHVRVRLFGNARATPEIAALRLYGDRFSYRDHYLPELYRESHFGPDADLPGPATPADFLDRFLGTVESVLTPLEDRVAQAHLVTDPRTTPDSALEWLGSWVGAVFDPAFPPDRRRAWIAAAHRLHQTRGTLAGLQLALEIATGGRLERTWIEGRESEVATGGAVTGGEILVLEDFRLRRTFATILGAALTEEHDPLLPGLRVSSNSYVGDTLFLGETWRDEFLALYQDALAEDAPGNAWQETRIRRFFDRLAHRVTVFVRQDFQPHDMGLIRRIVAREAPAHLIVRVVTATYPFLTGLASLVDVDTYLTPRAPRRPVRVHTSRLGERDFLVQPATLDPRVGDGLRWQSRAEDIPSAPPLAVLRAPDRVRRGDVITLDGGNSVAAENRTIVSYYWSWQPDSDNP